MALEDPRQPGAARPPGVLWPAAGQDVYDVGRLALPDPLSVVGQHYWWVRWRLAETRPFRPQVLSHPVAHLTVEAADGGSMHGMALPAALVHGLVTRVFSVELPLAGRVAGVAFHPGGLAALLDRDVRDLTDRVVLARELFGDGVDELSRIVLAEPDEQVRCEAMVAFLGERLEPGLDRVRGDTAYRTVRDAVELMRAREHTTIAPVAERVHVSSRTLQRMFARYVGASPLWVLRRYRLQDAAAAIDAGEGEDLGRLAADLGFADQAHLTRSFTEVIGVPPSTYRAGRQVEA